MQMPTALITMLILVSLNANPMSSSTNQLYLFTNDGTFYRMNAHTKEVDWYSSLNYKLMSFDAQSFEKATYFIPTIDGDFLYIDQNREMLIERSQVQNLLDICFMGEKNSSKYFVYQKYEYYVLNSKNGKLQNLQDFIRDKKIIPSNGFKQPQYIILSISKKFLKQLAFHLQVRWSAISSTVNLMTVQQFFQNPTFRSKSIKHSAFRFQRTGTKSIIIQNKDDLSQFQLESNSPIISIFSFDEEKGSFSSHKMEIEKKPKLAIEWKNDHIQNQSIISKRMKELYSNEKSLDAEINLSNMENFPLVEKNQQNEFPLHSDNIQNDNLLFCINTFRNIKRIEGNSSKKMFISEPPTIPFSHNKHQVIVPKQQPIALIFSGIVLLGVIYFLYRIGIRQMLKELARVEEAQQNKIQQLQKRIDNQILNANKGEIQNTIHVVNWESIVKKEQEYTLFEGRFLGKEVNAYIVATQNHQTTQKCLQILFKVTLGNVSKLLYISKIEHPFEEANQIQRFSDVKHLAIFSQKTGTICHNTTLQPRQLINDILNTVKTINEKLPLKRLLIESIFIDEDNNFKIDPIPNLLPIEMVADRKRSSDSSIDEEEEKQKIKDKTNDTKYKLMKVRGKEFQVSDIQTDLVKIIYFIQTNGNEFDQSFLENHHKNQIIGKNLNERLFQLQDFLESVIFEEPSNSTTTLLQAISEHPFLWDLKQRMLFVLDFSNYLETHTDQIKLSKLEATARDLDIIKVPWNKELHPSFTKQINSHRKYDYTSIRDLIRVVRNKVSHFHELPKDIRVHLGKTPEQFVEYFLVKFPKLLPFMHAYCQKKKWKLHV